MKKMFLVLLVLVLIVSEVTPGYCETPAFRKFRRGFCNVFTFYLELFHQVRKAENEGGAKKALTVGVLKGAGMVGVRAVVGAYELLTFPLPLPQNYEPILKDPEFFWAEPFAE